MLRGEADISVGLQSLRHLHGLDGKTGLRTGLLAGKQDWKCPVSLLATCCGSKLLKVILIDSDFGYYPLLKGYLGTKMGDGGGFRTPCVDFSRPVEELEYSCLLKSTFTQASHDRGFKT